MSCCRYTRIHACLILRMQKSPRLLLTASSNYPSSLADPQICGLKLMLRSMRLHVTSAYIWTCCILSIACIPSYNRDAPAGLQYSTGRVILPEPLDWIKDLDAFCKYYYHNWWKDFRVRRQEARKVYLEKNPIVELIPEHFTDYSAALADTPIEGISGRAFIPAKSGYRGDLYGCTGACQDIRLTLEIIGSRLIDKAQRSQQRAKRIFGFPCPTGTKSSTIKRMSKRQWSSPAAESSAIALLSRPELATSAQGFELEGDSNVMVTSCECKPITKEDEIELEHQKAKRAASAAQQKRWREKKMAAEREHSLDPTRPQMTTTPKKMGRPRKEVAEPQARS